MANDKTVTNYKYFIIAEILAVASFVLNAINVIAAKEGQGPGSMIWQTNLGVIYWLKTIIAVLGLVCAFKAQIAWKKNYAFLVSFCTMIVLWYSIPFINMVFETQTGGMYRYIRRLPVHFEYHDRIIILLIWLLPVIIIVLDIFRRSILYLNNRKVKCG